MKKKISTVVLPCLACIGMLAFHALPVAAFGPDNCSHPNYALGTDGATGEYEYLESGHYEIWGMGHTCLKCGYTFYTDTHFVFDCGHDWESIASEVYTENGVTTYKYPCKTSECDRFYTVTTQVTALENSF